MKLLFPLLGLGAAAALLAAGKANAAPNAEKKQKRAEWLAAIAHAKTESYEQYVKVLNAAYKTGLFSYDEIATLQKQHPKAPKAGAGSTATASVPSATGKTVEQRVADALATNNPAVMRALAKELKLTYPQAAADLENMATALEKTSETFPTAATPPKPTAPKPGQTSSSKPKPKPAAKPKPQASAPAEAGRGPAPDQRKALALEVAKHLTLAKKGKEDKGLVEKFQRSENQKRILEGREGGINPDGKYGVDTAYALAEYDLVPPKPLYWGKDGSYASMQAQQKDWKSWCLSNASKDPARSAEWTGASKVK